MSSLNIKDVATRNAVQKLEDRVKKINSVRQVPVDAELKDVIIAINKITDSLKR